jgi:amidohydrolase/hippurate hydrolase
MLGNLIFEKAKALKADVTVLRQQIHQNPELGMKEYNTTALIKKELKSYGVEIVPIAAETGVLGIIKGEKTGSDAVTALRADIDALPILEKTGVPYASANSGAMHACGHDGHTAVLLGTARLLSSMRNQFSGTVKLIFQPGEETLSGAKAMVKAGVLDNPRVESLAALHAWPYLPAGKIGVRVGPYHASADYFKAKIIGTGGHGGYHHKGTDCLLAATEAVGALQSIVSRQLNAIDNTVLSVCTIHGGTAFNIIPTEVEFTGTVRCHNMAIRNSMKDRMDKIIGHVAEAFGCSHEFEYIQGIPMTINDPDVTNQLAEATVQALGEEYLVELAEPVMGSEDFSLYQELVPKSAFIRIGNSVDGKEIPVHTDQFNFNDDAIPYGIAVLTQFVLNRNQ